MKVHKDKATAKKRQTCIHILTLLSEDEGQHFSYRSVDTHGAEGAVYPKLEHPEEFLFPRDGGAWWAASLGSHRTGHDWCNLAAAAAAAEKGKLNRSLFYRLQYFRLLRYIYILHIIYIKDQKVFKLNSLL